MINWRLIHNYVLLSAFAFKILILGTLLTLAAHNVCWAKMVSEDMSHTVVTIKQRKRNDKPAHHAVFRSREAALEISRNLIPRKLFILPVTFFLDGIPVCIDTSYDNTLIFTYTSSQEKIFLKHCSLLR